MASRRRSALLVAAFMAAILCSGVSSQPGLRPDDGDLEVGGAGKDTTCPVPSAEERAAGKKVEGADGSTAKKAEGKASGGHPGKTGTKKKPTPPLKKEERVIVKMEDGEPVLQVPFEELYKNATELADTEAQFWLAKMFENGFTTGEEEEGEPDFIPSDIDQAAGLYTAAASGGHSEAACALGCLYAEHNDPDKAAESFLKAAELGNVEAVSRLGILYEEAGHTEEALTLYTQGAEGGDPLGQAHLAEYLAVGRGVDKDVAAAARLYKSAADMGEPFAHGGLGMLYEQGVLGGVNLELAADHYRQGAEGGDKASSMNYARCLRLGLGVAKDCELADSYEPQLSTAEEGLQAVKRMTEEAEGAAKAGTLVGGRPSRYEYLMTYNRPQTEEEKKQEAELGWDGSYPFLDDTIARYRYKANADYYSMPGVVWSNDAGATAAA